jgi:hypothetical protein
VSKTNQCIRSGEENAPKKMQKSHETTPACVQMGVHFKIEKIYIYTYRDSSTYME